MRKKSGFTDELDKSQLLELLKRFDGELERKITLVAAGGTALTLLDAKPSTLDIDFTAPSADILEFERAEKAVPHGYKIDKYKDGAVFTQILPDNYLRKSRRVRTKLKNINLRALHPVDIVATKIGRLDERDKEDIETCINKFRLSRHEVEKRSMETGYAGNEDVYESNRQYVLTHYFH